VRDITEKVSYLQGLSEGLNISEGSPQGKIISGILSVLEELSDAVVNLQWEMDEFREYVESIDDDLFDLEESIYDDEDLIEVECQHCGEELVFDADILEDDDVIEVICPIAMRWFTLMTVPLTMNPPALNMTWMIGTQIRPVKRTIN